MTDMIEKIARAMCEADGFDWADQTDPMRSANGDENGQAHYLAHAKAALTALEGVRLVPVVWDDQERDRLEQKFVTTSEKHGHYETLFAVAAEGIRIAQERMIKAARGDQ